MGMVTKGVCKGCGRALIIDHFLKKTSHEHPMCEAYEKIINVGKAKGAVKESDEVLGDDGRLQPIGGKA